MSHPPALYWIEARQIAGYLLAATKCGLSFTKGDGIIRSEAKVAFTSRNAARRSVNELII